MDTSSVTDRIYEAAVVPELWPKVLEELTYLTEGAGSSLIAINGPDVRWIASPGLVELMEEFIAEGWDKRNARAPRLAKMNYPGFVHDLTVMTHEELDREPFYTEWLRPRGFGWAACTMVPAPSGDLMVFNIERYFERGPIEQEFIAQLDGLRPDLARAALMSARLGLERARAMTQALEAVGLPAAVLRRTGRIFAANARFEALMPAVARDRQTRLHLADAGADALFADALARLAAGAKQDGVRSIPLAAKDERPALIVHLLPVRGVAQDVFSQSAAIVVVTPVEPRVVPGAEVLQGLFDLTPAEAKVARAIAEGRAVDAISDAHGLSRETVRSQLKAVLDKTGLNRQAELAALLAGLALPRP
jgi:DNA-binding CsgD family transcriptional regulator